MKPTRRKLLLALSLAAATSLSGSHAFADTKWPTKPVTVLVGFAPGGAVDYIARQLTTQWAKETGQQFVIVNRPGATGSIASAELTRATPDGYTVMVALDSHVTGKIFNPSAAYDPFKDFYYVSQLVTLPQVLVAPSTRPYKTLEEMVSASRSKPLSFGFAGIGSTAHKNIVQLQRGQPLEASLASYRGAGPMSLDVIGGHVDVASGGLSVMLPHIKEGTVRALAVSSLQRSSMLPDVPAISELVPGHNVQSWIGLVTPAGTPEHVNKRLLGLAKASLDEPTMRKTLEDQSFSIVASTPDEFRQIAERDFKEMESLVDSGAIKLD